jgi:hypothetical protein
MFYMVRDFSSFSDTYASYLTCQLWLEGYVRDY